MLARIGQLCLSVAICIMNDLPPGSTSTSGHTVEKQGPPGFFCFSQEAQEMPYAPREIEHTTFSRLGYINMIYKRIY